VRNDALTADIDPHAKVRADTPPMKLRALIVDDEPLARERLRDLLSADPEVEVVGECGDGREAVTAIRAQVPDLVFLDVQMPELDGFGVVQEVGAARMPVTVFVTAFDQYALKAFEVHALDYLLKPYDRERFESTLGRVKAHLGQRLDAGMRERLLALLGDAKPAAPPPLERIPVKSGGSVYFLRAEEIDWVEAAGNYSRLHTGKRAHLLRETMTALEAKLDPKRFVRIHRSTIINIERVRELQPYFHGDYIVLLHDGTQLTLSRNYRQKLHDLFGHPF
jgi:two-component system LytT family response regulator